MAGPRTEDREHAALLVDEFVTLIAQRYGITPGEVVDAVKWVQQHRNSMERMKHTGMVSLVSVVIGAALLAAWEGIKSFVRGDR